jgi:hypothetical protein
MLRAKRIATTIAAMSAAIGVFMTVPALAAAPRGTLTIAEYKQLSNATAALNRSASAKAINWSKARAACRSIGGASVLLRSQRTSCLDSMAALEALANFPEEQTRCAAATSKAGTTTTGTTTTGTTTSPDASAGIQTIICLNPHYQALSRYAKAIYSSDTAARKQALARGFSGVCLATLASTPADLTKEKLFASSAAKLAADVTLLIKVTRGRAPTSDLNQTQIDENITKFESTASAVLDEHGPQKLSACPHQ